MKDALREEYLSSSHGSIFVTRTAHGLSLIRALRFPRARVVWRILEESLSHGGVGFEPRPRGKRARDSRRAEEDRSRSGILAEDDLSSERTARPCLPRRE